MATVVAGARKRPGNANPIGKTTRLSAIAILPVVAVGVTPARSPGKCENIPHKHQVVAEADRPDSRVQESVGFGNKDHRSATRLKRVRLDGRDHRALSGAEHGVGMRAETVDAAKHAWKVSGRIVAAHHSGRPMNDPMTRVQNDIRPDRIRVIAVTEPEQSRSTVVGSGENLIVAHVDERTARTDKCHERAPLACGQTRGGIEQSQKDNLEPRQARRGKRFPGDELKAVPNQRRAGRIHAAAGHDALEQVAVIVPTARPEREDSLCIAHPAHWRAE
jgi:hypothetical protein